MHRANPNRYRILVGTSVVMVAVVVGFGAGRATSQEEFPMAQPTKEHEWLKSLAGQYTATMTGMMGSSPASSRLESTLGGFWLVSHFDTTMMGQPYQGMELLGYDPAKKKFVSVWADSMSTMYMTMEGTYDAKTKTLTMHGEAPGMNGETSSMTYETKYADDGGMVFEMFMEGADEPMMTIDYEKK